MGIIRDLFDADACSTRKGSSALEISSQRIDRSLETRKWQQGSCINRGAVRLELFVLRSWCLSLSLRFVVCAGSKSNNWQAESIVNFF
jgi:hypothetical protein